VIPVIDLFAGPGGLGEGFASLVDNQGSRIFRIALSIEMNDSARTTLRLRSFYRQFAKVDVPDDYYQFLRGEITVEDLYRKFPEQAAASDREAWQAELGKTSPDEVDRRISVALNGAKHWLLIGGPPCQAYSLVGRSRQANLSRKEYESDLRHFLYQEYLRIIAVHRPPIFVMENVKGILSSKMKGSPIVDRIISDLKSPLRAGLNIKGSSKSLHYELHPFSDYNEALPFGDQERDPSDYIIRSELHGIPQARHRFIVLGVRSDSKWTPAKLPNLPNLVTVRDAIGDLPRLRSRLSGKGSSLKEQDTQDVWVSSIREMSALHLDASNGVDPEVTAKIGDSIAKLRDEGSGSQFREWKQLPVWNTAWFGDSRLQGVCNHESRRHMKEDLWRYMFAACFAAIHKKSPTLMDFPPDLLPDHKNIDAIGSDERQLVFADRFRVQVKSRYSTTITSHISKDGHYFIHYDPQQCRSLSVREAARLQTFPDNYFFMGGKTVQYQQVGNAVPPLLASKLARIVAEFFELAAN
jgi:DNA (cytosine-5)-methyltransferase 1